MTDEQAAEILAEALHEYYPADATNEIDPNDLYGVPEDEQLDFDEPWADDSSGGDAEIDFDLEKFFEEEGG